VALPLPLGMAPMQLKLTILWAAAAVCLASPLSAQSVTQIGEYAAVTDRNPYSKPALPAIGPAGSSVTDPVFKSTIRRITDGATRPGTPNRSYRSPSSPHQNAWSANGTYFYIVSSDGTVLPYSFDATTGSARRVQPTSTGSGGLVLNFYIEPQFSFVSDSIIYGSASGAGSTLRTIDQFDFSTKAYTRLLDLDAIVPGLAGTYIGGIASSSGPTERLMTFFGGTSQDRHYKVVVFDRANTGHRLLLDTKASTVNGAAANIQLNFLLHHAWIDRSGRYVMLYPTAADQASARKAAQSYVWDTQTNLFTEMPVSARPYGHDAFGFGVSVNQDCCAATSWDAAQWQFRQLSAPLATHDVIATVLSPKEVYLSDHTTWNNARPDRLAPFISGLYRYGVNTAPWRAWDDEIIAVQSDAAPGTNPTVWRFAHHRSNVAHDSDPARTMFWYMPRPNVSNDGRWVLYTSNWEKTLGSDPTGEAGAVARQDVFLVALRAEGPAAPAPVSNPAMSIDTPGARAALTQPFAIAGWAIDAGASAGAGVDAVHVWAYPSGSGAAALFVGSAAFGGARPDLAPHFGAQFVNSGFGLTVRGLAPGTYQLVAFARSTVTGTFNNARTVTVTIGGAVPRMSIDVPGNLQTAGTTFTVAGWAFDPNAGSGSGVDAIHVWAFPSPGSGAAPRFVGTGTVGFSRPDVAAAFGAAGESSGYGLSANLPAGVYDLVVYAHSAATGTFNNAQVVRITVR
jgi:hypothetical protein